MRIHQLNNDNNQNNVSPVESVVNDNTTQHDLALNPVPNTAGAWIAIEDLIPKEESVETLVVDSRYYDLLFYIPRQLFSALGYGKDTIVTGTKSGAIYIGKFGAIRSANYGLSYVRNYIEQIDFEDKAAKLILLEIFDANISSPVNGGVPDLSLLTNFPFVIPANGYQMMAQSLFANLPVAAINRMMSNASWLPAAISAYNYALRQEQDTAIGNLPYLMLTGMLKYMEHFPPALLSVSKELTMSQIKHLWKKSFIFNTLVSKCSKENLAPKLSNLLDSILKIYSEDTPSPRPCILNDYNEFIDNNRFVILNVDINTAEGLQTTEVNNQIILSQITEEYVKSAALEIFAKAEAKRLYSLIKSLGTKLSIGAPGSRESMAFDVMLASLANPIAAGIEEFILTEGHTAISASEKIKNAEKIAQTFGLDLKRPSNMQLFYASIWLKRPDVSLAVDQVINSFALTGPIANVAMRVRDEINGVTAVSCQNLTWGYSKLKAAASKKTCLLLAAAPIIPIAYAVMNEYNKYDDGFRPKV